MALYRVQCRLPATSGVVNDLAMNTWHFIADDLTALALAVTSLGTFYDGIDVIYPGTVDVANATYTAYDLDDEMPRAPVLEGTLGSMSSTGNPYPTEMAICLSFQAPRQSGVAQARRRGRVFLGPLDTGAGDSSGRPATSYITAIHDAADGLLTASDSASTWSWAVYSPTAGVAITVTNGWVDNAFDVQRRRGVDPTSRQTFSL